MEQHRTQEHVAALCVAGTLGVAATGFALASQDARPHKLPDRSKWSGMTLASPQTPMHADSSLYHPGPSPHSSAAGKEEHNTVESTQLMTSNPRRLRDVRPETASDSVPSDSRGSSLSRIERLRPRTADTRSTSEKRDPSTGSSWLKRLSAVSTSSGSSPAVSIRQPTDSSKSGFTRPSTSHAGLSNKLVKRSTSVRATSDGSAKSSFLRRPATSHQRSAARESQTSSTGNHLAHSMDAFNDITNDDLPLPTWRPFFERGYLRKRHSMGDTADLISNRTLSTSSRGRPTLILGSSVDKVGPVENEVVHRHRPNSFAGALSTGRHRLRRSLSSIPRVSRRRYFTDPVTTTSEDIPVDRSPISPISTISAFEVDLSARLPARVSNSPLVPARHKFSVRKRESAAPSDPTTLSSDNDTRVFTDDDSLEFQSDTAYDSLATRATNHSQGAMHKQKLDALFIEDPSLAESESLSTIERMLQNTSLQHTAPDSTEDSGDHPFLGDLEYSEARVVSSNAHKVYGKLTLTKPSKQISTKVRGVESTPNAVVQSNDNTDSFVDDMDTIDWSPQSDSVRPPGEHEPIMATVATQPLRSFGSPLRDPTTSPGASPSSSGKQRLSIFDWSENQRTSDTTKRLDSRPKTVHGKQAYDSVRSRSSGRKAPNQLHLRSQSVPSNRDTQADPAHTSASKFGTWGLGHKPVSEEWSDDFEFDDVEEEFEQADEVIEPMMATENRGSLRGVKVPQSIIDRQASVHIQFGQVQEFMMLVEELKRLRAQGVALDLLESESKTVWEDAESIINLATINDDNEEEEDVDDLFRMRQKSPRVSDTFGDEFRQVQLLDVDDHRFQNSREADARAAAHLLQSIPATPPSAGRPRGESLAQAKTFLQTIHQNRGVGDTAPAEVDERPMQKLPFDTQDLRDLVIRSGVITRALKDIVRKAEGVSVSPQKLVRNRDPTFSQIFRPLESSPCPPPRRSGLPNSSRNSDYLNGHAEGNTTDVTSSRTVTATV